MGDAYEARYNELVKTHENGDREAAYDLVGKVSVTFEQDIAGLDRAYQRQVAGIEGYIICQQRMDGAKFFKSTDTPAEAGFMQKRQQLFAKTIRA